MCSLIFLRIKVSINELDKFAFIEFCLEVHVPAKLILCFSSLLYGLLSFNLQVTGAAVDSESKQEDASSVHSSSLEAGPLIHPNDVFKALRTFAEENRTPLK